MNCEHTDCAAYSVIFDNKCRALTDTDFQGRECPFYKPAAKPEERKETNE